MSSSDIQYCVDEEMGQLFCCSRTSRTPAHWTRSTCIPSTLLSGSTAAWGTDDLQSRPANSRYQIQRHARKLGGRAFAPAYRLAPQYPFPCGLLDCLAAYLYLIDPPQGAIHQPIHPSSIIVAGDSAGGGCALSLLIMLRDLGLPMPAGADLLSPWVDLSHSFPSILANAETDYIPGNGFHFKPSLAWPPVKGTALRIPGLGPDDESIEIDEQIQLYCPNVLITHPLVSPVNQGSLGGLCPLLIVSSGCLTVSFCKLYSCTCPDFAKLLRVPRLLQHSGGGELLRDEQIYLAHKAANPSAFPPSPAVIRDYPILANQLKQHQKGSRVQLQVFDGCAHVIPTLAMTLPAKYMYRSAANFNLWAIKLAKAKLASHGRNDRHPDSSRHDDSASHTPSRASTLLVANGRHDVRGMTGSLNSSVVDLGTQDGRMSLNKSPEIDAQSEADEAEGESSSSSSSEDEGADDHSYTLNGTVPHSDEKITVTGALPSFGPGRIIRQRVSCKGKIRSMESMTDIEALHIPPHRVGQVHAAGPVSKWLETRQKYEKKYAKEVQKYRKIRADDYQLARDNGFLTRTLHGEEPPHCAIASWYDLDLARKVGRSVDEVSTKSNAAVMMYMRMSQKPDEEQVGEYTDSSRQAVQEVIATEGEEIKKTASRPAQ